MDFQQEDIEREAQGILLEMLSRNKFFTVEAEQPANRILARMETAGLVKVINRDKGQVTYELAVKDEE